MRKQSDFLIFRDILSTHRIILPEVISFFQLDKVAGSNQTKVGQVHHRPEILVAPETNPLAQNRLEGRLNKVLHSEHISHYHSNKALYLCFVLRELLDPCSPGLSVQKRHNRPKPHSIHNQSYKHDLLGIGQAKKPRRPDK